MSAGQTGGEIGSKLVNLYPDPNPPFWGDRSLTLNRMTLFDLDKWQEIYLTLSKNKLRTFMTAFGVGWGIFMTMVMLGAGKGLENGVRKEFAGFATNSLYIWGEATSIPYNGFPRNRSIHLNNDDIALIRDNVSEVDLLAPRNQLGGYRGGNNVTRKNKSGAFSVMGDYPAISEIQSIMIDQGRFINALDIEDKRKVAIIGTNVVHVLFEAEEDPIGQHVLINGVYFKVVGVFKTKKGGQEAEKDENTIFIPFSTFQHAFNYGNRVGWFALTSHLYIPASLAEAKVLSILMKKHQVSPDDERAFGHFNAEERFTEMNNAFIGINGISWFVGIMTLFAGVIGVSNIMLVIIKERTKELGIRRAIGATPFNIISQVLSESLILTALAGYFGLVFGVGLLELINYLGLNGDFFQNPAVDFDVAMTALIILVIAGLLAGLIPANRAVRIRPVDALRKD